MEPRNNTKQHEESRKFSCYFVLFRGFSLLYLFIIALSLLSSGASAQTLETLPFEMKGCIQTIYEKQFVIRDNDAFLKAIRNDASREQCVKDLEKINFSKHTLLGIEINSGHCGTPPGLEHKAVKDETKKQYVVEISWLDPKGSGCRALSQYDLWLLVPKLPEGFEVKFEVKAR
jgi:hypothetical protein